MEDYSFFAYVFWIAVITWHIMAIVIMFWGWKTASKAWRISIGIALILMFIALLWASS